MKRLSGRRIWLHRQFDLESNFLNRVACDKYTEFGIFIIQRKAQSKMKTVIWVASSKRDLEDLPESVMKTFGYALFQAQQGDHPDIGKILRGFGGADVIELIDDAEGGTYRGVYTVRFSEAIIVLHVFQKKSKKGIETPKQEIELIKGRLKRAEELYKEWKLKG